MSQFSVFSFQLQLAVGSWQLAVSVGSQKPAGIKIVDCGKGGVIVTVPAASAADKFLFCYCNGCFSCRKIDSVALSKNKRLTK